VNGGFRSLTGPPRRLGASRVCAVSRHTGSTGDRPGSKQADIVWCFQNTCYPQWPVLCYVVRTCLKIGFGRPGQFAANDKCRIYREISRLPGVRSVPFDRGFNFEIGSSVLCVDCRRSMFPPITIIGTKGRVGTSTNSADSASYTVPDTQKRERCLTLTHLTESLVIGR
jgi:hypothetical protein